MTTNGHGVDVGTATALQATPFRLKGGRVAIQFDLAVSTLNEPGTLVLAPPNTSTYIDAIMHPWGPVGMPRKSPYDIELHDDQAVEP